MPILENVTTFSEGKVEVKREIRALFVTNSLLYVAGLQLLLAQNTSHTQYKVCIKETNTAKFLLKLHTQHQLAAYLNQQEFQLILISAQADFEETCQTVLALRQVWPECVLIWLDISDDQRKLIQCIETGATGFFSENEKSDYFCQSLIQGLHGEIMCSPKILRQVFQSFQERSYSPHLNIDKSYDTTLTVLPKLTKRELEVLQMIHCGLSNREISEQLVVVLCTVKHHIHNIFAKLQVSNRHDAILKAVALRLLAKE